jgi:hypothetical protein
LDKADCAKIFVEPELRRTRVPTDLVYVNNLWCLYCRSHNRNPMSEARIDRVPAGGVRAPIMA